MSWWKDGNYYKDEESCTEYSSRVTRPPMTSFRSHEKKEWKETSRERGSKKEKEKKKQNNVTSPVQSSRINDEKKQKYNSKQKSIEAKGGSPDFSSHSRRKTKNERGAPLLGRTRMDLYACIQWPGIVNQAELNQCQSSINI